MARAIWSGSINFGLVNVPVKAYTATKDHKLHFREVDKNGAAVRHQKVSSKTGKPVEEIKLGFETSKGHYVRFSPDELDALRPESTRTIDVSDFVDLADIDPIFYNRTYWLGPANDDARNAYALLRDAMDDQQKVGIGSVVMRRRQYLAAIRPVRGALALSTMRFADEVIPSSSIDSIPKRAARAKPKELALARQIIDTLAAPWKPERYHDTYTEQLRRLVTSKSSKSDAGDVDEPQPAAGAQVVDLMEALEASVKRAKSARSRKRKSA